MRIFISGPSGVGKSTLIKEILSRHNTIVLSISYTTRPPRPIEKADIDYFFVSKETFKDMLKQDAFLEWAEVHGHLYGTSASWVEAKEKEGLHVLFDIDVQGVSQAKAKDSPGCFILIVPPTMEDLAKRLNTRGTEDSETLALRLKNATNELKNWDIYDYLVVNDSLEQAQADIENIIQAHLCSKEEVLRRLSWLKAIE
ncbi:MAG: guanylate kinase [Deltaproteobacteria bacterium]|nr:guanylate kinase [Deltaproteobacteria bacterium]